MEGSKINFRIIDGEYDQEDKYEAFKDHYVNHLDLTIEQIRRKLSISSRRYNQFSKRLRKEESIRRIPTGNGARIVKL